MIFLHMQICATEGESKNVAGDFKEKNVSGQVLMTKTLKDNLSYHRDT